MFNGFLYNYLGAFSLGMIGFYFYFGVFRFGVIALQITTVTKCFQSNPSILLANLLLCLFLEEGLPLKNTETCIALLIEPAVLKNEKL